MIGRLLYDSQLVFEDQLKNVQKESKRPNSSLGAEIDLSLLFDGLQAEREQGITIDVAYRYFSTPRRKFIVADTPGHVQYTRNMATGASNCDFGVLLIDARQGVLTQTRRHACILSLLGIKKVALAVNKMDLIDFDQEQFEAIVEDFTTFAEPLGFESIESIPVSALKGDNVTSPSANMHWYHGPTLLGHLETVEVGCSEVSGPFRFPVQWVNRPHLDFRGVSGTVAGGRIVPGDEVVIHPSGKRVHVARIVTADGDLEVAQEGDAVTLTFAEEVDGCCALFLCQIHLLHDGLGKADFIRSDDTVSLRDMAHHGERRCEEGSLVQFLLVRRDLPLSGAGQRLESLVVLVSKRSTQDGAEWSPKHEAESSAK